MARARLTMILVAVTSTSLLVVGGCGNDAMTGASLGALAGAGVGQLAGGNTESSLIGAAVGGGVGYILGNESERKKSQARMYAMEDDINSQIVNVTNSNGSIVQVRLRRQGVGWVGTRGEYYPTLPTEDQLRPVYGF